MAHKKGLGSTRNGRDSNPQYLGVKRFGGEKVNTTESRAALHTALSVVPLDKAAQIRQAAKRLGRRCSWAVAR